MKNIEKQKGRVVTVDIKDCQDINQVVEETIIRKESEGYKLIEETRTVNDESGKDSVKLTFTMWTVPIQEADVLKNNVQIIDEESWLILSDFHLPYHDDAMIDSVLNAAKKNGIKNCIHLGDILDFEYLSSHGRTLSQLDVNSINETIKEASRLMKKIIKQFKKVVIIEGNHDQRVARDIVGSRISGFGLKNADGYEFYSIGTLLGINGLCEILPYGSTKIINDVVFSHGDQHNMVIAPNEIRYHYCYGHVHKLQQVCNNQVDHLGNLTPVMHTRVGCFIKLEGTKIPRINSRIQNTWTNGFGVLTGNSIENVLIEKNHFMFRGKRYVYGDN